MTRLILAAGVAAMAITAPAASQDRGRDRDRGSQVQKQRGGEARTQRAERRQATQQQRAQRTERVGPARQQAAQRVERRAERPQRAERQQVQRVERRVERPQRVERVQPQQRAQRVERVQQQRAARVDRVQPQRIERQQRVADQRVNVRERQIARVAERNDRQLARLDDRRERQIERIENRNTRQLARLAETRVVPLNQWNDLARGGVWLDGCPPGLARKPVACVPPGQVKNLVGQPLSALDNRVALMDLPSRLRYAYPDTDDYYYRYGNGYVYRVDRDDDLISALLPLFGLGLTVGQPFPTGYSNYYMPTGLQPFYTNSPYTSYRYANGYMYQVDPYTGLIQDVDPLLGYGYGYGQMMPITYSAYNVPYQYRSMYYDTPDYYYRYAPGAIYQVDPTTSLITAVSALLTGGLTVGQPLPAGYGVYNVPYQYRTTYYDTPDAWYRYSNGYVYRVDPTTQLVTAIVASALT